MTPLRIAIIGGGEQTRRTHLPCLEFAEQRGRPIEVPAVIDLHDRMAGISLWVHESPFYPSLLGLRIGPEDSFTWEQADVVVQKLEALGVDGVIVSTEASAHWSYVQALTRRGLPFHIDKPFFCPRGVSLDPTVARSAITELHALVPLGVASTKHQQTRSGLGLGSVNVTRRHNPHLIELRRRIKTIENDRGQHVTHLGLTYSDGEIRDYDGCVTQREHPFNRGYGGLNHSGYHAIDTAIWLSGLDRRTVQSIRATASSRSVGRHLREREIRDGGNDRSRPAATPPWLDEVEYDCDLLLSITDTDGRRTDLNLSILHTSTTNRRWAVARGDEERLHLGRLSSEVLTVNQGEFATYFARIHEVPHPTQSEVVKHTSVEVTLNPRYAKHTGRPVHETLTSDTYDYSDLSVSPKWFSVEAFLDRVSGLPHSVDIDLSHHVLTQTCQLLAAAALASGGVEQWSSP